VGVPKVTTREEWSVALERLSAREQELIGLRDAVAEERRRLPMIEVVKDYVFNGPEGSVGLPDLFAGRQQLIVYHFWLEPGEEPCQGCSWWLNNLGHVPSLHDADTSIAVVSRAPSVEIEAAKERNGWTVPWFSLAGNDFNDDMGYTGEAQITVFLRAGNKVFRTYSTAFGRMLEILTNHWTLLELTPLGAR
jgi:predicted dithiol-disulfide oxidoreductase (DUF899 family)